MKIYRMTTREENIIIRDMSDELWFSYNSAISVVASVCYVSPLTRALSNQLMEIGIPNSHINTNSSITLYALWELGGLKVTKVDYLPEITYYTLCKKEELQT